MEKRNFLLRVLGRIKWWFKWEVLRFPENVETYGVWYSLQKIFTDWWWYDLKNGVKNLVKWFPVIWNDRDWDWHYWVEVNLFKLREMEKCLRDGNHLNCETDADNIHKAVLALERLKEDDYLENVNRWHDKKYGTLVIEWLDADGFDGCKQANFKTSKWTELTEKERKLGEFIRHKNYRRADYLKQQDLEYATKIINKYLFHWWD